MDLHALRGDELGARVCVSLRRRVTLLTNTSPYPLLFSWSLGPLEAAAALAGGKLVVSPHSGA